MAAQYVHTTIATITQAEFRVYHRDVGLGQSTSFVLLRVVILQHTRLVIKNSNVVGIIRLWLSLASILPSRIKVVVSRAAEITVSPQK